VKKKLGIIGFVALVVVSAVLDRGGAAPDTGREIFDLAFFAVLWAALIFVGAIAFRVLRRVWGWSEKL
jgi:hypothetical protein